MPINTKFVTLFDEMIDMACNLGQSEAEALIRLSYNILPYVEEEIEVKSSTFGRGVFATKDIDAEQIVTFYPVHLVGVNVGNKHVSYFGSIPYDKDYSLNHPYTKNIYVGDKTKDDLMMCGHIINDFFPTVKDFENNTKYGETIVKYLLYAISYENCRYDFDTSKRIVVIRTTKPIKSGEELLLSYGPKYWTSLSYEETYFSMMKYIKSQPKNKQDFIMNMLRQRKW